MNKVEGYTERMTQVDAYAIPNDEVKITFKRVKKSATK
jgi:hypothetical protein